jgi:hypothetical protein
MENIEPNKENLCYKIKQIYYSSCEQEKKAISVGYFNSASIEINKIAHDLQNFCCINAINSMLKHCVK